jgi:hypothetical protein
MEWMMRHAVNIVISSIWAIVGVVMEFITYIDTLLAGLMRSIGIPEAAQTILLIIVAILLIVLAVRLFSRFIAVIIVILLVLLLTHNVDPKLFAAHDHRPVAHSTQGAHG